MRTKFNIFSEMKWLDKEEENEFTKDYINMFKRIKEAQKDGTICDDFYIGLYIDTVDYGYYIANIHYDIYENNADYNLIEKRLIYFLNKCDKDAFKNERLKRLFWGDFRTLLINKYKLLHKNELFGKPNLNYVKKYGSDIEKWILSKYMSMGGEDINDSYIY